MAAPLGTRLLYYFTGFGIGIIFVIFFFQNRGCTWTPNNRVKQAIVDRVIVINDDLKAEMDKRGITKEMIKKVIDKGNIDFKNSKKTGDPKVYTLYNDVLKLNFSLPESSYITEVSIGFNTATKFKNSTQGEAELYLFPAEERLLYIDSITTGTAEYIQLGSPDNKAILKALKKDGKVNFEKSNYKALPKAEHYLTCTINNQRVGMKTFWYKDRINIFFLELLQKE